MPRSGWPEAEILLKPAFRRQGLGTEMWKAITGSWDSGDEVIEELGYVWEEDNAPARGFFAKVLTQKPVSATGSLVDFDRREGRDLELVRWSGTLEASPLATTEELRIG
ncbi:hypothetical protein BJ166DRAFT_590164 [Pestalotiopsis sp. NC0098]|nr:hypothetical protein BJ166DRAFT_590164 [Pestalotiopsis sp. NC0098]